MTTYKRGDVILVNIAFSGAIGYKRRPAVIISTEDFNTAGTKYIVAALTSNLSRPLRPGDTRLRDWRDAGLVKPSAMRGVLATVDKSDIVRRLGSLSALDMSRIEEAIAEILAFVVPRTDSTS